MDTIYSCRNRATNEINNEKGCFEVYTITPAGPSFLFAVWVGERFKGNEVSMKKQDNNWIGAFLIVLVLAFVPLIVSAKKYSVGLSDQLWFSSADTSYDFFLYWKGQALLLLCGILSLYVALKMSISKKDTMVSVDNRYMIPLGVYFLMSLLSTLLSQHRRMAVWGGYEQWEGMLTLGTYVVIMFFSYYLIQGQTEIRIVLYGLLAGVFILSLLGARQFLGHDFFRTAAGKAVMNFMSDEKLNFTFNFAPGRVYATLYNPNYVGSYVALMLPVTLSLISFRKRIDALLRNGLAAATAVFLVIMLFGSESVTGFIGLGAVLVLFTILMITNIKKHPKIFASMAAVCILAVTGAVFYNKSIFEYGYNKIMNPMPNHFVVKSMVSREGALEICTAEDDLLRLVVDVKDGVYTYEAKDEKGSSVEVAKDGESESVKLLDQRFEKIQIQETSVEAEGEKQAALVINTPSVGKSYTVVLKTTSNQNGLSQKNYQIYNPFKKLDGLREIPAVGFEDKMHFASRRGYIWSRTFPLLPKHLLLGSGPNTFVYEFPNDDYVGMKNVGYDGSTVTKPHNMFMQIFVQTGLLSLLAFLALYGFYFAECMRLYWRRTEYGWLERFGTGLCLGTFGYLVTGLANDSTVAVAPLYWCLLGVGIAVNRRVAKEEDCFE